MPPSSNSACRQLSLLLSLLLVCSSLCSPCSSEPGDPPQYTLVRRASTWQEALVLCDQLVPGSQLARVLSTADYAAMALLLANQFPNAGSIFDGVWIGLNAIDSPDQPTPSTPGVPATGWRWADGVNQNGPLATPPLYWGGPGTGAFGQSQPDNDGGDERCALIVVGALPPTPSSPFYDDLSLIHI